MCSPKQIKECLIKMNIDEVLAEQFANVVNLLQEKAQNGQAQAVARLKDLLTEAVQGTKEQDFTIRGDLETALQTQICKVQISLENIKNAKQR